MGSPLATHLGRLAHTLLGSDVPPRGYRLYVHYHRADATDFVAWYAILRDAAVAGGAGGAGDRRADDDSLTAQWRQLAHTAARAVDGPAFVDGLNTLFAQLRSLDQTSLTTHLAIVRHEPTDTPPPPVVLNGASGSWGVYVHPLDALADLAPCTLRSERPMRAYVERLYGLSTAMYMALEPTFVPPRWGNGQVSPYERVARWLADLLGGHWDGGPARAVRALTALLDLLTLERGEDALLQTFFDAIS